ncbi:hypothetical protein FB451DRAFT_1398378 [Mycena latifolia]|nr:hypothetical protein FB451DRAFT_1398378 [Mycena latifolia]
MPQLQHLDLRLYDHGSPPPVAYHDVPRLRSATLWDFDYPPELLPWTQLTSLTLVCKLPTECTTVLQHTVNLVHCELVTADVLVRPPDVKLERLESLARRHIIWTPSSSLLSARSPSQRISFSRTLSICSQCSSQNPDAN